MAMAAKAPKDPVLLTVDGQPVHLSEFEYLYHKNADQQLEPETVEEYLQRFIDYKLKVTQARHERVDTTAEFRKEFLGYRKELAAPYLRDSLAAKQILEESYAHTLENINLDLMIFAHNDKQLADSVRNVLLSGKDDFAYLARRFSADPTALQNGGHYGWITGGMFPYEFEEVIFNTPKGEVSPVFETRFGVLFIRVNDRKPSDGEIHAAHILIGYDREKNPELAVEAMSKADSIYQELKNGADFAELARKHSSCPSGARGGDLDWFGHGQMVAPFDEAAFALADGEISKPVATQFGYHIIKRLGTRMPDPEKTKAIIAQMIQRDARANRPVDAKIAQLKDEYNARVEPDALKKITDAVAAGTPIDSVAASMAADRTPLIVVADSVVTIGDFLTPTPRLNPRSDATIQIEQLADAAMRMAVLSYEDRHLEQKYPEFRNISREYSDGLMLFASMDNNVWQRPNNDPKGLKAYFEANRERYSDWTEPRWKGFLVYATSDSLISEVDRYITDHLPSADSLGVELRRQFPRNIKIERVVLPKGQNAVVDYFGFGGPEPDITKAPRWKYCLNYMGRLISQPEEAADIRGRVTADWTKELEDEWVEKLRKTYPVKVNKKVLKKVK